MSNGIPTAPCVYFIGSGIVNAWDTDWVTVVAGVPQRIRPDRVVEKHEIVFKHLPLTGSWEFEDRTLCLQCGEYNALPGHVHCESCTNLYQS